MESLAREFADIASFFTIWVREAHAGGNYPQPETVDGRCSYARDFLAADHVAIPVVMDDFGGSIQHVMGGFPNSVYIIDPRGRVAYRANWADSREVHRVLNAQREVLRRLAVAEDLGIPRWSEEVSPALNEDPANETVMAIRVWEEAANYGEPERFMGPERAASFRAAYERATGRQSIRPGPST